MRRGSLAVLLLGLALVPAAAFAAGGSGKVYVSNCTKAVYKPSRFTIACADASLYASSLTWSSWTHQSAAGKGKLHANLCTPSCASGKFKTYSVKVALSKPKACKKHKVFKTLTVTYGSKRPPSAPKKQKFSLGCPS